MRNIQAVNNASHIQEMLQTSAPVPPKQVFKCMNGDLKAIFSSEARFSQKHKFSVDFL